MAELAEAFNCRERNAEAMARRRLGSEYRVQGNERNAEAMARRCTNLERREQENERNAEAMAMARGCLDS
jgi:hypothetical protein